MWSMFNSGRNAGNIVVRDQSDSTLEGQFRERNAWAIAGSLRLFEECYSKSNHGSNVSYAVKLTDPFDDAQWPKDMQMVDRLFAFVILPGKDAIPPQPLLDPKRVNAEVWDRAYLGEDTAIATLTAKKCCCCKQC